MSWRKQQIIGTQVAWRSSRKLEAPVLIVLPDLSSTFLPLGVCFRQARCGSPLPPPMPLTLCGGKSYDFPSSYP